MSLPKISPREAKRLVEQGATLIDIREADEHARSHIPGAYHLALSKLAPGVLAGAAGKTLIFHCRSGARTAAHAPRLAAGAGAACEAYILEGGLDAWRAAGLPVATDQSRPIELQRQVQIAAGGLAFVGTLLGLFTSPWFFAVPLFVGAGLMTAGITGFCGMARLLMRAPWNRRALAAQSTIG
jgi:rhodanese-related sulfurtransferase